MSRLMQTDIFAEAPLNAHPWTTGNATIHLEQEAAATTGDYHHNNVVDGADYVHWRTGFGTIYTQNDYSV
jgi:hypothetical protein